MYHGKPMILIPLFGDQQLNSMNVVRIGMGTLVERSSLSRKTLTEAIQRTLGNKKIIREAAFVSSLLSGRPQQYRNEIAKWAKIIIKHGKMNHLLLHSRHMNLIQYYCLDILALLVCILISLMFLSLWLLRYLLSSLGIVKQKRD
ncbi:hypothetical protein Y032_0072g645 [Ancylostoma ceylanicum]|uniref:glucuronosyltransferase n=1 Tax=Ancylostoma ceylanicum TaxID=53326 RepID=A0A016TW62_9BILA|nr:hypothetical protein Y032_0072g645 [Ancylostoma ceylanicum]